MKYWFVQHWVDKAWPFWTRIWFGQFIITCQAPDIRQTKAQSNKEYEITVYIRIQCCCMLCTISEILGLKRVNLIIHRPPSWYRFNTILRKLPTDAVHPLQFEEHFQQIFIALFHFSMLIVWYSKNTGMCSVVTTFTRKHMFTKWRVKTFCYFVRVSAWLWVIAMRKRNFLWMPFFWYVTSYKIA